MKAVPLAFAALSLLSSEGVAQITSNDYPPLALRMNHEGRVAYRLHYGPEGRATDCAVTMSSGFAELDNATCALMMGRTRFALGSSGTRSGSVTWTLPVQRSRVSVAPAYAAQSAAAYQAGRAQATAAMAASNPR